MVVTAANLKLYKCTTWTEGDTHGGAIDTGSEIPSSGDQVIFDDVSDAERQAGDTEYRKVFFRNENAETVWIMAYISKQYDATNQEISIALGTDSGVQSVEGVNATYSQPINLEAGLDLGSLAQNASKAIWIKRVVTAGGDGRTGDSFSLTFGMY